MDGDAKRRIKNKVDDLFRYFEEKGWIEPTSAYLRDYHQQYPKLRLLEEGYPLIRQECEKLLGIKDKITDIKVLGGNYTTGGIHVIKWKSFMLKSGKFIPENTKMCPQTTAILRKIPGVYTAFFSILDPHQYVTPHWGYYKGFLRYHLGVIIPNNNEDHACYLRVNGNRSDNQKRDRALIENGQKYHWKNGEGVVFDDTYLHDAENGSGEVRVVLWVDIRRKMPLPFDLINRLFLAIAHREASIRKIRKNAVVDAVGSEAS